MSDNYKKLLNELPKNMLIEALSHDKNQKLDVLRAISGYMYKFEMDIYDRMEKVCNGTVEELIEWDKLNKEADKWDKFDDKLRECMEELRSDSE